MSFLLIGRKLEKRALELANGDIYKLEEYSIKAVRELQRKLNLKGAKTAIILDADKLSHESQNALLKILEEPPKNTIIILTAFSRFALLPTIASRCQIVKFEQEFKAEDELDKEIIKWRNKLLKNINKENLYALKEIIRIKNLIKNTNTNEKLAIENLNLKLYGKIN